MKKILFMTLIVVFGFCNLNAQSNSGDVTLAPQIGVNGSSYLSDSEYNFRTSFTTGAVLDYYFNNRWSLRSGLVYDTMGAEDDFYTIDKLNYLSIPINANWHFGKNRNWYLNFGPQFSFLVDAKSEFSDGIEMDIKELVSGFDFGLAYGIGYKFNVDENFQLFVDFQGFNGFIDVDESKSLPYPITNVRTGFNFGAIFTLK